MKKVLCFTLMTVLLAACADSESRLFGKAKRLTDQGKYSKAIAAYSAIIKKNPESAAAYASRGLLYEQLKAKDAAELAQNRKLAKNNYEKAASLNINQPEILNNLAALYIDEGNYTEALLYLNRALSIWPNYVLGLLNRAVVYSKQGRYDKALVDFSRVEELNPRLPLLYLNRGLMEYAAGYYASAADDFSRFLELEPDNARGYLERGRAFIKMDYFQNAMDNFQQAIALRPDYAMPYFYAGELLFSRGDADEGIAYAQRAKELAPRYVPVYKMLGDMLALESPVEATQHYLTARQLDPKNAARYQMKIRMMTSEDGRKRVVYNRFVNLGQK